MAVRVETTKESRTYSVTERWRGSVRLFMSGINEKVCELGDGAGVLRCGRVPKVYCLLPGKKDEMFQKGSALKENSVMLEVAL